MNKKNLQQNIKTNLMKNFNRLSKLNINKLNIKKLNIRKLNRRPIYITLLVAFCIWTLALPSCSGEPTRSVKEFVRKTKEQKGGPLEPLPTLQDIPPYPYTAGKMRDPFEPGSQLKAMKAQTTKPTKGGPDMNRRKEALEAFSLDSLKMVGILQKDGLIWVLIRDPNGRLYHIGIGNHLGLNYGAVEKITEKQIDVREWIQTNEGVWSQRVSHLILVEVVPVPKQDVPPPVPAPVLPPVQPPPKM